MRQKAFLHVLPHHASRGRWIARLFVAAGFAFLYTFGLISTPATTHAAGVPGGNIADPFVRAVDIARPAVVRILTTIGGHLTVDFGNGKTQTFPLNGGSYKLQLSGSGAFISSQGDILTADHVVHPPHDQSLDGYLDQVASSDVANYINENFQITQTYTAQYTALLLVDGYLPSHSNYDDPTSEVYMSTEYTGPLTVTTLDALPTSVHSTVDQIKQFSPFDQNDVAIIHVPRTDTPSIQVGDSSNVEPQDELRIVGFPGNGDVSNNNNPADFLAPSINQVFVSATNKKTDNNAAVIQVGGNVEHGDSGGPALDSSGEIMGIVSFGLEQAGATGITSFLQASNSARMLITTLGLNTKPGNFQTQWTQAFNDYSATSAGHWHQASADLSALAKRYTDFQAIAPYLSYAQNQASHEQVPQKQPTTDYTWYIVGGIIILLVLIILIYVATRRRYQPVQNKAAVEPASSFNQQQPQFGMAPDSYQAIQPALTPQLVPIGQAGPNPGQTGQFGQGIAPSEDMMLTYPGQMGQAQPGPMQSGPDLPPFQPSGTPSQPIAPASPYQPARMPSSEPWTPYQVGGQPSPYAPMPQPQGPGVQASPSTPFDRPGAPANPSSPYQPATPSPYQPIGQAYPPPAAVWSNTGDGRPAYPPTPAPPVRPITGEVWQGMGAQPFNATPAANPAPTQNPAPNPPPVPPWLRQDIYARPQASQTPPPQQPQAQQLPFNAPGQETPGNNGDQEKTVRSAGNLYGSNPSDTEIRDRSGS